MQTAATNLFPNSSSLIAAHDTYATLAHGTAGKILAQIDLLYALLLKAGIPTRPYSPKSAELLLSINEEKRLQVLHNLTQYIAQIDSSELAPNMDFRQEVKLVEKVLQHFRFSLKNRHWDFGDNDQIVEVYNNNGVQLYRSMSFFKTCGYSLLDLSVNEWFVLWERPQRVLQEMNSVVGGVLTGKKHDTTVDIAPHLVLEIYDDGCTQPFQPRAIFVNFKNIYPLYGPQDEICGFVVSSSAKLMAQGEETLKINFI